MNLEKLFCKLHYLLISPVRPYWKSLTAEQAVEEGNINYFHRRWPDWQRPLYQSQKIVRLAIILGKELLIEYFYVRGQFFSSTSVAYAFEFGHISLGKWLYSKIGTISSGALPLLVRENDLFYLKKILDVHSKLSLTNAILLAAKLGRIEILDFLLNRISEKNRKYCGNHALKKAIEAKQIEAIQYLKPYSDRWIIQETEKNYRDMLVHLVL